MIVLRTALRFEANFQLEMHLKCSVSIASSYTILVVAKLREYDYTRQACWVPKGILSDGRSYSQGCDRSGKIKHPDTAAGRLRSELQTPAQRSARLSA